MRVIISAITLTSIICFFACTGVRTANSYETSQQRLAAAGGGSVVVQNDPPLEVRTAARAATPFPLHAGPNNRYLVDQKNVPFLMVGDAPQTMVANLSLAEAERYMANRERYGINALWVNLLCNFSDGCDKHAATFDGISPFMTAGDLATPNPAYFQRVDEIINIAAAHGIVVLLDPIETTSWLAVLRANGPDKAFEYGQYLGRRYRPFLNIIWLHGNDLSWQNAKDDGLVLAVARGIRNEDPDHIHTVELNPPTSGSLEDPRWSPLVQLNAAYTYFPTYAQVLTEYNRPGFKPVIMIEASYEFEHNPGTDGGSTQNLRRQEYWTMLSGGAGQLYGSYHSWRLEKEWETNLDTPGVAQLCLMKNLFDRLRWYDLIPDQNHIVVTAGYDSLAEYVGRLTAYLGAGRLPLRLFIYYKRLVRLSTVTSNTYAPAARTSDGTLVVAYLPSIRTITVDMSKLAGPTLARWYDPTSGNYVTANGSPYANTGSKDFTPPGNNNAGDGDWVLVLEAPARSSYRVPVAPRSSRLASQIANSP